jgi:hypothetical protein
MEKPLLTYDQQKDLLKIFQTLDEVKAYSIGKSLKYGILREDVKDLRFNLYSKNSIKWITEKDTTKEYIYCETYLLWKETGQVVMIKDYGYMKLLRENVQFQKLMKDNEGKEFLLMNDERIHLLQKLLYDRKSVTNAWYDSVEELISKAHSAEFFRDMDENTELLMTEEFKTYYKTIQKKLLSRININLLD